MSFRQSIPISSIQNARELGGYQTADHKRVKKGLLLRTAKLSDLSSEDIALLRDQYHLSDVIDFRMEMELPGYADPPIEGTTYHHIDVMDLSGMDPAEFQVFQLKNPDLGLIVDLMDRYGMMGSPMYISFLESEKGKQGFREFFHILLSAPAGRAVLWHCTSGKDRTGLAAMLLLTALGVDEQVIMDDYLLTNEYNAHRISGLKQALMAHGSEETFVDKAVFAFESVDESFLRLAMEHLKDAYGSVLGYINNGLHISDREIAALKDHYLEEI